MVQKFVRHARTAVTAVSALCLLGTTIGVPVWLPVAQDASVPFPCQHHGCGCRSAEQCWRDCCCFSPAEKLTWAQQNGVQPPAYVVAAATQTEKPRRACCGALAQTTKSADQTCCEKAEASAGQTLHSSSLTLVFSIAARKCQGLEQVWLVIGAGVPVQAVTWNFDWRFVETLTISDRVLVSHRIPPPTPPPWC